MAELERVQSLIERFLVDSCAASGVPLTLTDQETLAAVAEMLRTA